MFGKESKEYANKWLEYVKDLELQHKSDDKPEYVRIFEAHQKGAEFGYNKANESHSPDEHIYKNRVVLGVIKHCNKTRYSLVQWNGEWWYQYGTYNAEVRLIAWYNIPELKESE